MHDLDIQIREYIDATSEPLTVDEVLHVTVGDEPVRPITLRDRGQRSRRGWLIAAAAAAAALVLIGGFGLLVRVVNETDDAPVVDDPVVTTTQPATIADLVTSTTAAQSLDEVVETEPPVVEDDAATPWRIGALPPYAETGTIATPLGDAHWVRLSGSDNDPPWPVGGGHALPVPEGFAVFQPPRIDYSIDPEVLVPAQLWVSADGIDWRVEELPVDAAAVEAALTYNDGVYWLTSIEPNGLWRSTDAAQWEAYDPSGLATPGPGWHSNGVIAPPVTAGDVTLTYGNFNNDHNNSNTISDLHEERLYLLGDGEVVRVEVPWPTFSNVAVGFNLVTLFGARDWIYAYVEGDQRSDVWRTSDGRSWTNLGAPGFPESAAPIGHTSFTLLSESLVVTNHFALPGAAWETTDGTTWSPVPDGLPAGTYPTRLESGWFASDGDKGGPDSGDTLWMQVGGTWVSLADMGMERLQPSDCWVHKTAVGTTTFFLSGGCPGSIASPIEQDILVLSLSPAN